MFSWLPSISRCWVSKSNLTSMLISFLRFAKNIDPSQISLKFLKGEGELTNLELDEAVLSDLLEFPPWLQLTKVTCNRISAKVTLYFWFWPHKKEAGLDNVLLLFHFYTSAGQWEEIFVITLFLKDFYNLYKKWLFDGPCSFLNISLKWKGLLLLFWKPGDWLWHEWPTCIIFYLYQKIF